MYVHSVRHHWQMCNSLVFCCLSYDKALKIYDAILDIDETNTVSTSQVLEEVK